MTDEEWLAAIQSEIAGVVRTPVVMETYRGRVWDDSFSLPAAMADAHGNEYVVKSPSLGIPHARAICTEQIVTSLGRSIDAPVPKVAIVEVTQAVIDANDILQYLQPGVCHGSHRIPNTGERWGFDYVDEPQNRPRFASIALLWGWMTAADHQLIYTLTTPHTVYSVDHGHFFPGTCWWTSVGLDAAHAPVGPDGLVWSGCRLTTDELRAAAVDLLPIGENEIIKAVAMPPAVWGISDLERVSVARYLKARLDGLRAQYP